MTLPILIDTDPGLDDAVGLLYALADPGFALKAVTSVAGNIGIDITTANVGRLLAAMGRGDIPYAVGAAGPVQGDGRHEIAIHGQDGLGGLPLPAPLAPPDATPATAFLAAHLHAAPAQSRTVLALGPLTNLALLSQAHPAAYARIGRIIAMGGTIHAAGNAGPLAEFNMAADPRAAQMVFAAPVPVTLIPLDVTRQLRATPDDLDRLDRFGTDAASLAARLIRAYFAGNTARQSRPLHDPCVMLMARTPQHFGTESLRLTVDCDTHPGRLTQDPSGAAVEVALRIDASAARATLWHGLGHVS